MIREWWESLRISAPADARRLGYVDEVVAIAARHSRHRAAWAPHLEATRGFLAEVAVGGELLVLLGAGHLLDVPLERLAPRYVRVLLVDWVLPPAVRRWARRLGNVDVLEADVTGCLGGLRPGRPMPRPARPTLLDASLGGLPRPGSLVVSLNLASQLPVLPERWLARWGLDETCRAELGAALIRAHLNWLAELPARACLIADVERRYSQQAADGTERTTVEPALAGLPLPPPDRTWPWEVAPRGEIARGLALTLTVGAWGTWTTTLPAVPAARPPRA